MAKDDYCNRGRRLAPLLAYRDFEEDEEVAPSTSRDESPLRESVFGSRGNEKALPKKTDNVEVTR